MQGMKRLKEQFGGSQQRAMLETVGVQTELNL